MDTRPQVTFSYQRIISKPHNLLRRLSIGFQDLLRSEETGVLLECCYDCEGDGLMIVTALQDNYHTHNVLPGDSSDGSNIEY